MLAGEDPALALRFLEFALEREQVQARGRIANYVGSDENRDIYGGELRARVQALEVKVKEANAQLEKSNKGQ